MAYIRPDSAGKRDESPHPVSRPAPALKNKPAPKKKKANPNRTLTPRQESLDQAFGGKYKAQTGKDLRSNPGLLRALLESNVADVAAARDVMASDRVKVEHIPPIHDQDFANQFVVQLRKNGMSPLSIAMLGGKLSKSGRARDAGFLQTAQNQIDAFEALSRKQGPGREVEKGLEGDAVAEAVLGGLAGGVVAGGVKAVGGAAAKKAAGGLLGADALEGGAAALRYTVPTRGILKHIVPNRPSVARPLADFAGRSGAHRIAAGSGILAAAPASEKIASKAKEKADAIRGAVHVEVDPSELSLDAQAIAAGEEAPKGPNLAGLRKGPGRLGLSPPLRKRLLHQARVNGWPVPDSVNDTELVAKAYKRNSTIGQRLTAGLVENAGNAAFVPAFAGAVYDAASRTAGGEGATPTVEIAEGMANSIANAAHHPIDNPLFFASILSAGVKGVGKGSAKVLGVKEAPLKFKHGEIAPGVPYVHTYGTAAANTLTRPAALLGQKMLNRPRAAGARNYIMAKQAGREGETITTRARATGEIATRDLAKALSKIGKKEQVLAVWSHLTGSSAANQASDYRKKYDAALQRKEAGEHVDPVNLRALKAKAQEWEQLAHLDANLTPAQQKKIEAFGDEAAKIEELNQGIMRDFGLSPETMKDRLWMQALEQHPTLKSTLKDIKVATRQEASDQLGGMQSMLKQTDQTASALFSEAGKWQRRADAIKGKTESSRKRKAEFDAKAEKAFELAARVQGSSDTHVARIREFKKAKPYKEKRRQLIAEAEAQARTEMQAGGVEPKMWVPHTPLDAGPASFVNPGNPFLTKGRDRMGGRMKENTGTTLRTGQIDERPSLAISAAAKPSQIKSMTDDVETFLHENAHPLSVTKDRGLVVDGREFVYIKSTKDGKLNRGAIMRRAHDQAEELEKRGLGDQGTIDDLMGLIFEPVEPRKMASGAEVIDKGEYWVIPRAKHQAWMENARTEARRRDLAPGLHKVARTSTGLMINTLPRTNINNLGGIAMSALGGAGPIAHLRYLRDPKIRALVPPELVGRGVSGSQTRAIAAKEGATAMRPARWWTNRIRTNNVLIEDFPRGTLAVNDLLNASKKIQHGSSIKARMHRVNEDTMRIAGNLRETHPAEYKKAIKHTIDFVGDMGHLSKLDPGFQIAIPFWRWSGHILKSVLYTMPKNYPLRAILLQSMGEVGREYQREHGIWPSWMQGAIDLGDDIPLLGGVKGEVNATLGTSGWWPYATQSQWIAPTFDDAGIDPGAPFGNVSPVISMVPALAGKDLEKFDSIRDADYNPIEFGSDQWKRMILARALQMTPTPYSRSGQTNTSLPWDPEYKDNGTPRRGNDPLGLAMRAFGLGTTPVLTGGPDLKKQGAKAFKRAKTSFAHLPLEEKKAMAGAWRQNDDGSYSTIIDLGHGH